MAEIVVKIPNDRQADYDFIAFSFNGKHSFEDFGLIRTSDGSRYNINLAPTMQDKTAEVPGGNGMYYFGTTYKQKDFPISFAFDEMDEATLQGMKRWLNGDGVYPLWFAEEPYKVYMAKVTGTPSLKLLPFEIEGKRVYKGEGSVSFTAYNPFARTPDFVDTGVHNTYYSVGSLDSSDEYTYITDVKPKAGKHIIRLFGYNENTKSETEIAGEKLYLSVSSSGEPIKYNKNKGGYFFEIDEDSTNYMTIGYYYGNKKICTVLNGQEIKLKDSSSNNLPILNYKYLDGQLASSYTSFANYKQWIAASGLSDTKIQNGGTLPASAKVEMYSWNEITEEEARR